MKISNGTPIDVTIMVNGKTYSSGTVPVIAALTFTANDCLDFGKDLGSPQMFPEGSLVPHSGLLTEDGPKPCFLLGLWLLSGLFPQGQQPYTVMTISLLKET